jgi:hypothetical protein
MSPSTPGQYRRGFRVLQILQRTRSIVPSYHWLMMRTHVYLKVELEVKAGDDPRKLADELCRRLMQAYGVRAVEVSSLVEKD